MTKKPQGYDCAADTLNTNALRQAKVLNPDLHRFWKPERNDRVIYRSTGILFRLTADSLMRGSIFHNILQHEKEDIIWLPFLFQAKLILVNEQIDFKQTKIDAATFLALFDIKTGTTLIRDVFDSQIEAFYDAIYYIIIERVL